MAMHGDGDWRRKGKRGERVVTAVVMIGLLTYALPMVRRERERHKPDDE
jgi:hypothetical protein